MIDYFQSSLLPYIRNCVRSHSMLITKMAACPHLSSRDHLMTLNPAFTNDSRRSYPFD